MSNVRQLSIDSVDLDELKAYAIDSFQEQHALSVEKGEQLALIY